MYAHVVHMSCCAFLLFFSCSSSFISFSAWRTCLIPLQRYTRSTMRACVRACMFVCHTCVYHSFEINWMALPCNVASANTIFNCTTAIENSQTERKTDKPTHRERASRTMTVTVTKWNDYDLLMFRILIKVQIRKTHAQTKRKRAASTQFIFVRCSCLKNEAKHVAINIYGMKRVCNISFLLFLHCI